MTRLFLIILIMFNAQYLVAQWKHVDGSYNGGVLTIFEKVDKTGKILFVGTYDGGVFRSTDDGINWEPASEGLPTEFHNNIKQYRNVLCFQNIDSCLFAGTAEGVYLSTDNGTSWTVRNSGLTNWYVYCFLLVGNNLYAGTQGGIFLSTNFGTSWNPIWTITSDGFFVPLIRSLLAYNNKIFAATYGIGIWVSTDSGANWIPARAGLTVFDPIFSLAAIDSHIFAGAYGGVYLTTDCGNMWSKVERRHQFFYSIATAGNVVFAGGDNGVFVSTDYGSTWTQENAGVSHLWVNYLFVHGGNILAATSDSGIWRRSYSEIVTTVRDQKVRHPSQFHLYQNYPNPFNPSTSFSFTVPVRTFVTLKVFDVIGKEITTVVSEELTSGIHSRKWNAQELSSGIYFYRLQAGSFSETKKLLLLR